MRSGVGTRVVPFILNEQFLRAIFGDRWIEALVSYFAGDPQTKPDWRSYPAGTVLKVMGPDLNNYYDVSLPRPGGGRGGGDFGELYVIVLDDYGIKVDKDKVEQLLGVGPSYVIETSPGNYHAGWLVEPLSDRAWVVGLLRSLYRALGAGDNLVKPTTLVRLPVGTNGKVSLGLGPGGWKVRLIEWRPGTKIKHSDWVDIEARIGSVTPVDLRVGVGGGSMPDPAEIEDDVILGVLRGRGMVRDQGRMMTFGWGFEIECPWSSEHLDPRTAASYVPVKERFKCHHGHCENRTMADLRVWADEVVREDSGGLVTLAALEFDDIDPATIALLSLPAVPAMDDITADLWDQKTPAGWPGGVLRPALEDTLAALAHDDGLDLGALGAIMMTVGSGASDKRSLLRPYAGSAWMVRPVLWTMLLAQTGQRKTSMLAYPLKRLRALHADRMRQYSRAIALWKQRPAGQKHAPGPIVAALLAEDATVEKLQEWMSWNPRGMLYLKDELAGMFDWGRYSNGPGAAERAFFLETNEGGPYTVARMTRTTHIDNTALAILGGMQPERLDDFKGLTADGLLSRFATILATTGSGTSGRTTPPDLTAIDATIDALLRNGAFDDYGTDATGESLIRETEIICRGLADRPDIDVGQRGFLRKLHGVQARAALVLHLMDGGQDQIISADTIARAGHYVRFLYSHAEAFYAGLPGSADNTAKTIGSYLLRHPEVKRITAGRLRSDMAPCRHMKTLKEIQDAVFVLVMKGWLMPETNYPMNNAWKVRLGLNNLFAARTALETKRVEQLKLDMNRFTPPRLKAGAGTSPD